MTITKSGNITSFYTVGKAPIKHLKVYFSPKQAGTGDPSPSNVREISGWNRLYGTMFGTNLCKQLPPTIVPGHIRNDSGVETTSSNYFYISTLYPVLSGYSFGVAGIQAEVWRPYFIDSANNFISRGSYYGSPTKSITPVSISVPSNCAYVQLQVANSGDVSDLKIYNQIHDWNVSLPTTIYGGYVDLVTGEVVRNYGSLYLYDGVNNKASFAFRGQGVYGAGFNYNYKVAAPSDVSGLVMADKLPVYTTHGAEPPYLYVMSAGGIAIACIFIIGRQSEANYQDDNDWVKEQTNNWLQNNNVNICCKQGVYKEVGTLTPTQLTTLIGQNNIWSNADRIEVEYDMMESNDELYRRRNTIIRSYPHIETTSGDIVSFNTDLAAPLKECKIHFNPVQAGSGTPSPENVREISGWDNITLFSTKSYVELIPQNWTQEVVDTAMLKYIGNNTFQLIGTVENGGVALVPVQPFFVPKNTRLDIIITKDLVSAPKINMAFRPVAAEGGNTGNAYLFRIGSTMPFNVDNRTFVGYASSNQSTDYEIGTLAIGVPPGNADCTIQLIVSIDSTVTHRDILTSSQPFYGGYIDLVSGKLVQTWGSLTIDSIGNRFGGSVKSTPLSLYGGVFYGLPANLNYQTDILIDKIKIISRTDKAALYSVKYIESTGSLQFFLFSGTPSNTTTIINESNTWAETNNITVVYKLETPIEYQLTPQQLKTLKGTNNIWSNTNGDISVKYWTH